MPRERLRSPWGWLADLSAGHLYEWRQTSTSCVAALAASLALAACAASERGGAREPVTPAPTGIKANVPLGEIAADILSRAIQIPTVNPPGDEAPLAEYYVALLREAGLEARVVATPRGSSAIGRAAAWGRLPGTGRRRPVVLLSHLDVVPADPVAWTSDPFSGRIADGRVVGRGALDAKGIGVVHLLTLVELSRRPPLARDVILLATPDEETGGRDGAGYIARRLPELVGDAEYLLTEGGGVLVESQGGPEVWHVAVTEKSPCWLRLEAHGRSGHAAVPGPDAAVPRLLAALGRIEGVEGPIRVTPEVERMFRALAPLAPPGDAAAFADLAARLADDPDFRGRFLAQGAYAALVRNTIAITVLEGSARTNVVPSVAAAELDVRLLPGDRCQDFAEQIRRLVGDPGIEVIVLLEHPSRSSPVDTPLYRAIASVARASSPDAVVVPAVLAGFTDAHYFRELGVVAYGFVPRWQRAGERRGIHGPGEEVSVENLVRGVRSLVAILEELDDGPRAP